MEKRDFESPSPPLVPHEGQRLIGIDPGRRDMIVAVRAPSSLSALRRVWRRRPLRHCCAGTSSAVKSSHEPTLLGSADYAGRSQNLFCVV